MAQLRLSQPRYTILAVLGQPNRTSLNTAAERVDEYIIQHGDTAAAEWSNFHGTLSVATLGAWEVVAIPVELARQGASNLLHLRLTYDQDELLSSITTAP